MNSPLARRSFLSKTLGGALLGCCGARPVLAADVAVPASDGTKGLSTYHLGPQLWVRWDNQVVTCYRAHRSQKFPYLFPLAGPATGLSLTAESALPYPHHRSVYLGCDRLNGGNYWQEGYEQGQVLSSGPRWNGTSTNTVEILDACDWQQPGGPVVMRDLRRIRVLVEAPDIRYVDWDIEWSAVEDVKVEKTNHSLFAVRGAPDLVPTGGGVLRNAEGARGEKETYGKKSAWCVFHGIRKGPNGDVGEGIALFDHPANPWSPCPWFTRDYGFMSPTPFYFRDEPWRLGKGQSVRMRYRLVLFAGSIDAAHLNDRFRTWSQ